VGLADEEVLLGRGEGVEGAAGLGGGKGWVKQTCIKCLFPQGLAGLGWCQVSKEEEGARAWNEGGENAG